MPYILSLSLMLSLSSFGATPAVAAPVQPLPVAMSATVATTTRLPAAQSVEQYVSSYFSDEPIMIAIASCESRFHQYTARGNVYRGEINNKDLGVMQINEYYQGDTATKLGLNLYTLQGNVAFARYLYEKEGTVPWASSSPCWDKSKLGLLARAR